MEHLLIALGGRVLALPVRRLRTADDPLVGQGARRSVCIGSSPQPCHPCPLLLWETPPGLELILAQEGIAFAKVRDPHPLAFQGGRFVLYDGRRVSAAKVRATLTPDHVPLDVDLLRGEERADPFQALIDARGQAATWRIAGRDADRAGRPGPQGQARGAC